MAWYALPRLLSRGSVIVLLPLYTRVLSPVEMGMAMVALAVGGVLDLIVAPGVDAAYFRWAYQPGGSPEVRARRSGTVAVIHLVLLTVSLVVLVTLASPITTWLLPGISAWPFYYLLLATAALSSLTVPLQTAWRAERRPDKLAALEVAHSAIAVSTILTALIVGGFGAVSLLLGDFVARVALFPWYVKGLVRALRGGWDLTLAGQVTPVAMVGLPLALSAWALSALDRVFLNRFFGATEVGIYSVAYQVGAALMLVSIVLNKEWQPLTFSLVHSSPRQGSEMLQRLWTRSLCVFLAFGSLIAIFSWEIVNFVLGERYLASAAIVPLVVLLAVLRIPRVFMTNLSLASGATRDLVIESGLAVVVFVVASLLLIPPFGGRGAACAGVLAYSAGGLFLFLRDWNLFRVDRRMLLWALVLGSAVALGGLAGGTVVASAAGALIAVFFVREAAEYWRFLGMLHPREVGS